MKILSHRCRGFGHPEHSVRAIREALLSPVDGIEIDIRLTKDLKWVVIHNPFTKNEAGQIQRVHAQPFHKLKKEILPLDTVLAMFAALGGGKELYIDMKDVGEIKQLTKMIDRHNIKDRTIIIGWEPEILKRVHKIDPVQRLGLSFVPIHRSTNGARAIVHKPLTRHGVLLSFNSLHSFDVKFSIGKTHQHYLSDLPNLPLHCIQVFSLFCSADLVKKAHARGLKVIAFVVNNRISFSLLKRRNVDGILSNEPRTFIQRS